MSYTPIDMANAFIQAGELPDALDALNDHLSANPDDDTALRLRAEVQAHLDGKAHQQAALRDLDALPQQSPADYMLRADILHRGGDTESALAALHEGRTVYPHDERLAEALVTRLIAAEKITDAQHIVMEMSPEDNSWRWAGWAADLARLTGDLTDAIQHYSEALQAIEARYTFDTNKAAAVLKDDDTHTEAAALTIVAAYGRLLLGRAAVYRLDHQYDAAEADLSAAGHLLPDDPAIPFKRGILAYLRGERDAAIALCELALNMATVTMRDHLLADLRADERLSDLLAAVAP